MHGKSGYQHGDHQRNADPAGRKADQQQYRTDDLGEGRQPGQQLGEGQAEAVLKPADGRVDMGEFTGAGHPHDRCQIQADQQRRDEVEGLGAVQQALGRQQGRKHGIGSLVVTTRRRRCQPVVTPALRLRAAASWSWCRHGSCRHRPWSESPSHRVAHDPPPAVG